MAIGIVPYLVAMLVAIGVLRASGALDLLLDGGALASTALGLDTRWVDGLPTGLMRTALRQRRARHDGRDHEDPGRRLLRRPPGRASSRARPRPRSTSSPSTSARSASAASATR